MIATNWECYKDLISQYLSTKAPIARARIEKLTPIVPTTASWKKMYIIIFRVCAAKLEFQPGPK